jgi:hypothetical protein
MKKSGTIILSCLLLTGCMKHYDSYEDYMGRRNLPTPVSKTSFPHCSNHDCARVQIANFWPREWKKVQQQFRPRARTPEKERAQIAKAIQTMEQIIGPITGTDGDLGDTFRKTGAGQLDCVDESTNTSAYLDILIQEKLVRFHDLGAPVARAPLFRWPHQTAVIIDKESGSAYAVDSWFDDNGQPIHIVPLEEWMDGWHPPKEENDE